MYTKTKSMNDSPGGPLMARVGYVLKTLQWDGNVLAISRRFILKQWKYRLLGVLLLLPVVYLLSASKLVHTTEPATSRKPHNRLYAPTVESFLAQIKKVENKNVHHTDLDSSGHKETLNTAPPGMTEMKWVRMDYNGVEDVFVIISAYYDLRPKVRGRPGIVIMAYEKELAAKPHLWCVFTSPNGSRSCQRKTLARLENVDCLTPAYKTKEVAFKTLVCPVFEDVVPLKVQLSFSGDCEKESSFSDEIPVGNQPIAATEKPSKRVGVCLQGALRAGAYDKVIQRLNHFISMSEFLGAEFINMYINLEEVDSRIVKHLLVNHSSIVNLVEWKAFNYDYHGQFGIIYDCLYRHMYSAEYLAFIDLDEMIIPFKHDNWLDMLDELEDKTGHAHPGYSFLNRMYTKSNLTDNLEMLNKCPGIDKSSVYLSWFNERQCVFKHTERSKMILSPTKIIHTHIHKVCKVVGRRNLFLVDKKFAINAHYRKDDLWLCWNFFTNYMYDWFRELLDKYTNSICKIKK